MDVEVKLHGQLRRYRPETAPGAPHHPFSVTAVAGATAASLAEALGIPAGFVNAVAINGEAAEPHTPLQAGDTISFFPPSAGGT